MKFLDDEWIYMAVGQILIWIIKIKEQKYIKVSRKNPGNGVWVLSLFQYVCVYLLSENVHSYCM